MIETTIITPALLPAFAVPDTAPNYWQELAAWTWVSNISAMSSDGHKIRQDDLVDGISAVNRIVSVLLSWLDLDSEDECELSYNLSNLYYLTSLSDVSDNINTLSGDLQELITTNIKLQSIVEQVGSIAHWGNIIQGKIDALTISLVSLSDIVDSKPAINPSTPNLIDDFFSNIEVDSDAIKVALQAIQSILTGGNVVLDLIKDAILEQVAGGGDSSEALNLIASRLVDEAESKNVAEVLQGLSVMPNELSLHINNIARKDSEDYQESWRAS